jgi:hypothetical protein
MIVAITSRNAGSVRTRTVASALYNMTVQTSNIIGANVRSPQLLLKFVNLTERQIYRTNDAPYYFRGNKVLIGLTCYNIALFIFAKVFYVTINR